MTLTESLSNVCPQFPSRLPRWPALAGLECVWQLAAAGGCALSVLLAWRPPINWWCVVWGWRRPDTGPASLPHRDQQEVVRTHWHNNPRPQLRWGRNASDWLLFQAFQCLCLVGRQKRSSDMECFIQLLNGQWSGFWIEQNYSLKCVAVGFNFYW